MTARVYTTGEVPAVWLQRLVEAAPYTRFVVPGQPMAWQRARRAGDRYFTSRQATVWRHQVLRAARAAAPRAPEGPLEVTIVAVFPRPQDRPRGVGAEAWASGARLWRPCDPDADDLGNGILDALQVGPLPERRWLSDDNRIVSLTIRKVYAAAGEPEHTEVCVVGLLEVALGVVDV